MGGGGVKKWRDVCSVNGGGDGEKLLSVKLSSNLVFICRYGINGALTNSR